MVILVFNGERNLGRRQNYRLQAVPFWIVRKVARNSRAQNSWSERAEGGLGRGGKRRKGKEKDCALSCNRRVQGNSAHNSLNPFFSFPFSRLSSGSPPLVRSRFFALGYFARPLDYPERDCLRSTKTTKGIESGGRKVILPPLLVPLVVLASPQVGLAITKKQSTRSRSCSIEQSLI